ncbi:hypothetical protein K2P97_10095 [bacterium]|nr:hypothetical protein [bacterium]
MNKTIKKKLPKRTRADQKERTEALREIYELNGISIPNMRGKHFKIERQKLRNTILEIYENLNKQNLETLHRKNGNFVPNRLLIQVVKNFDDGTLKRNEFTASNEKAIIEEIKNLQKLKKILKFQT